MNPRTLPLLSRESRLRIFATLLLGGIALGFKSADAQVVLTWTSGDILNVTTGLGASISTPVINEGVTVNVTTASSHTFDGRLLVNNGTIAWSGGNFVAGNGGTLTNHGTINDTSTGTFGNSGAGGATMTFTNAAGATYNKQAAGTKDTHVAVTNAGTLKVTNGTLRFNAGGSSSGLIDVDAGAAVQFTHDFSVPDAAKLTGAGLFELANGTLSLGGTLSVASFTQTGGTLAGSFTLASGNTFTWSGGNWNAGSTSATIASGATLNLTTTSAHSFDGRALLNQGTINWSGGSFVAGNGGTLTNHGTINDTSTGTFGNSGAGGATMTFTNAAGATYNKQSAGTKDTHVSVTNAGTLKVTQGTLRFNSGGSSSGLIDVDAGAAVQFTHDFSVPDAAKLTGAGLFELANGTLSLGGTLTVSSFNQSGGTLAGSFTLAKGHTFTWAGGNWNASGTATIASGGALTLSSGSAKDFNSRNITNSGTVNWQGGHLASGSGGAFVNAAGGTFNDLNAGGASLHNPFGGTFTFTNDGTYRKTGAGTTTVSIPFTNTGTLALDAGTLVFNGTLTNSGALALAGGAALQSSGALTLGTSTLSGTGTVTAPSVTAGGLVSPGNSSGTLTLSGNLTLLSTSSLLIELGGTTAGSGHDFLSVGGGAALAGSLSLRFLAGFDAFVTPTATFTVLTASGAGGLTGAFANVPNGAQLLTSDGRGIFQVNYGSGSAFAANSVVLSNFVPVPEPSTYVLLGLGVTLVITVGRRRRS